MILVVRKPLLKVIAFIFSAFTVSGCGDFKNSDALIRGIEERVSLDYAGPLEPAYCVGATFYSNSYTISGQAKYEYRAIEYNTQFKGLGEVHETPNPIRYAEFVVINNLGDVIQCGETDSTGNFQFAVPASGQVYRLQIRSRADNDFYKASVLRSPESNQIYVLERAFAATSNQTLQLLAPAKDTVLGGAFHILDEIFNYNQKLRQLAGTCPSLPTGCVAFQVAPKISIYWERGFNPGIYLPGSPASSFYYPGQKRLFLLGGINGDVDFTDTDHFDKSIIAHEYFHFLEDVYSRTSSPGGSHNGNQLIDPRLAWSEGIAQFFQAVMINVDRVLDTVGNKDGASQMIVDYSVENALNDIPLTQGEGEFREFSVARLLWDMHDDSPGETFINGIDCTNASQASMVDAHDACTKNNFIRVWAVLTGANGLSGNNNRFISSNLFLKLYDLNATSTDNTQNISPLRNYELQNFIFNITNPSTFTDNIGYGQPLTASGCSSASELKIRTPYIPSAFGGLANSHLSANNRYYYIYHGGGPLSVEMNSQIISSNGLSAQADIYLYPENYTFIGATPLTSNTTNSTSKVMFNQDLTTYPSGYPAGFYMIVVNVRSFNGGTGLINFTLKAGTTGSTLGNLCLTN